MRLLILGFFVLASHVASTDPCDDNDRLQNLINCHGVIALCASQGTVVGADSVCAATIGGDWQTEFPRDFATRTPRDKVQTALDWLCMTIRAMPQDTRINTISSLETWVLACGALEVLDATIGPEALGTAIAFVPYVADLFPRDAKLREQLGRNVGSSLATGEYNELFYATVRRLAALPPQDQAVVIHDLWMEAMGE